MQPRLLPVAHRLFFFVGRAHNRELDQWRLEGEFIRPSRALRRGLGQYALTFAFDHDRVPTPRRLLRSGLLLASVARSLRTTTYASPIELPEVARLRFEAYRDAGHFGTQQLSPRRAVTTFDAWDQTEGASRCQVMRLRGRAVGTIRVAFALGEQRRLPLMQYIAGCERLWPEREAVAEASRKAGVASYWWGDMFGHVMGHAMLACLEADKKICLICVAEDEMERWRRLGFIDSGLRGEVPSKLSSSWAAMSIDLAALWRGRLGFEGWRLLIAPLAHQLPRDKKPRLTLLDRARLSLFRLVSRLYRPMSLRPRRSRTKSTA